MKFFIEKNPRKSRETNNDTMTDCSSLQGSTGSSSSDAMSSHSGHDGSSSRGIPSLASSMSTSRFRVIRMTRPSMRHFMLDNRHDTFGFAVRGGREFGTGFFVSRVESGSEADIQGMRVGDQIIRVNGYHVEDAVHKEFTQYISNQDRLTLKVRGVGMLPIKEKIIDPLSWHIMPRHSLKTTTLSATDEHIVKNVRVVMKVPPKAKLGLGICKGPEWKPGIFVQFTKDYSIARDAGLHPGDQIISCNSIDFSDVLFSEAVAVMKSATTLELIIRTAAGLDLFPGESSGYNSSASSIQGDQSPCWADKSAKRLSMMNEEQQLRQKQWIASHNNLDRRKTYDFPRTENICGNNKTIIQLSESGTLINNTLITEPMNTGNSTSKLSGFRSNFYNNLSSSTPSLLESSSNCTTSDFKGANGVPKSSQNSSGKIADICFVSRQSETKTVIVEVHRSDGDENGKALISCKPVTNDHNNSNVPIPPPKPPTMPTLVVNTSNSSSATPSPSSSITDGYHDSSVPSSINSSNGAASLCNAISEELKKRKERLSQNSNQQQQIISAVNDTSTKLRAQRGCVPVLGGGGNSNERQHNALMDEFKRAHRKMFRNGFQETEQERQEELRKTSMMRDETDHRSAPQSQHQSTNYQHTNGHQNGINAAKTESGINNTTNHAANNNSNFPTPPPPPQFANKPQPPIVTKKFFSNGIMNGERNSTTTSHIPPPPPPLQTPTPDYDSTPVNSLSKQHNHHSHHASGCVHVAAAIAAATNHNHQQHSTGNGTLTRSNGEATEMESIDSYNLKNPILPPPKPPAAYFAPENSGPPTMKKVTNGNNRPISVTIGAYGAGGVNSNGYQRKEPSKFDFINGSNSLASPTSNGKDDNNVSHLLRSELELTLSRSNLKKRNENDINGYSQKNGVVNGNSVTNDHQRTFQNGRSFPIKTQSSNIEKLTNMLQNKQIFLEENNNSTNNTTSNMVTRVTINLPNSTEKNQFNNGKIELRKTESTPTNGILKNGLNRTSYVGDKSISFGN